MIRKPILQDGTVITNPDKNRLVEIPPRIGEPPDDKDSVSTLNATFYSKE